MITDKLFNQLSPPPPPSPSSILFSLTQQGIPTYSRNFSSNHHHHHHARAFYSHRPNKGLKSPMVIGNSLSSPHRHHHHHYPQPNKDLNPQWLRTTLHPSITVTPTITLSWPLPPPLCATMSPPLTLFDGHHPPPQPPWCHHHFSMALATMFHHNHPPSMSPSPTTITSNLTTNITHNDTPPLPQEDQC